MYTLMKSMLDEICGVDLAVSFKIAINKIFKPVFHLAIFSLEQAKTECAWVVMSSVFVEHGVGRLRFLLFYFADNLATSGTIR